MARTVSVLVASLLALGCDKEKGSTAGGSEELMLQKPTEDEVLKQVRGNRSRNTGLYGPSPTVTLLTGLSEVPDLYFTKMKWDVDPAAVCGYVSIQSAGAPGGKGEPPKATVELVVVGRDSGKVSAKDRGKIKEYQIIPMEYVARDYFGADWLAAHPWPKDAEKK